MVAAGSEVSNVDVRVISASLLSVRQAPGTRTTVGGPLMFLVGIGDERRVFAVPSMRSADGLFTFYRIPPGSYFIFVFCFRPALGGAVLCAVDSSGRESPGRLLPGIEAVRRKRCTGVRNRVRERCGTAKHDRRRRRLRLRHVSQRQSAGRRRGSRPHPRQWKKRNGVRCLRSRWDIPFFRRAARDYRLLGWEDVARDEWKTPSLSNAAMTQRQQSR
jgi:hypothetical protein